MTHDADCPARYGCCPNDEYGCVIHAEPPCNCQLAQVQWGVEFEDGEVELVSETALFTTRTPLERAEGIAREQGGTVVTRCVRYDPWVPRPSKQAAASEVAPTPCPSCGAPTWDGLHRNGFRECVMAEVETS